MYAYKWALWLYQVQYMSFLGVHILGVHMIFLCVHTYELFMSYSKPFSDFLLPGSSVQSEKYK